LPQTDSSSSSTSSGGGAGGGQWRGWAGAPLLRRSLANLFHFYAMVDPLPLFYTEGSGTDPVTGRREAAPLPQRRRDPSLAAGCRDGNCDAAEGSGEDTGSGAPRLREQPLCLPMSVPCPGLVEITVDGVPLTRECGDFPVYWQRAATEFRQELRISPLGATPAYATM
jgi:hypothetical protein